MGASMVKGVALDPYQGSSESDSKLYTKFEFCEEKFIDIQKIIKLQSQAINDDFFKKKILHIFEDSASGVQVGDIEQVII